MAAGAILLADKTSRHNAMATPKLLTNFWYFSWTVAISIRLLRRFTDLFLPALGTVIFADVEWPFVITTLNS